MLPLDLQPFLLNKLIFWNVRGFNKPVKHKEVVARITSLNPTLVYFLETKVKEPNMPSIINKWFKD